MPERRMRRQFLQTLHCPYCRGPLCVAETFMGDDMRVTSAILRCACYEYPVLDGIAVLRQFSGRSDASDPAVGHLRTGRPDLARAFLEQAGTMAGPVVPPSGPRARLAEFHKRGAALVRGRSQQAAPGPPVADTLRRLRPAGFADYLLHRYANPSFVASVAIMGLLEDVQEKAPENGALVLDLGCGTGHSTAMMQRMFPGLGYVGVDPDFVNLQIMRRHFVGDDVILVCMDAELPLPFADSQFAAVFCLDTLHYIRSKAALGAELRRVVQPGGSWLFAHLHNKLATNPAAGLPLSADGYRRVLGRADALVLSEDAILQDLFADGSFDPAGVVAGDADAALSMVSGPCRKARRYGIAERLAALDRSGLGINPIYRSTSYGHSIVLTQRWPSAGLQSECAAMERLLPTTLHIPAGLLERARAAKLEPGEEPLVADLIGQFVLVHLAPGYLAS
jgi:SAM-dependent methyltransferase/uncharacterized protein YbaR (Trm112 family)